ncbi:MAG TPA: carboxypeptidase-like regulatory domain-containing protein [Bryobacteraceae bacterium]|nr:carboxypeptidase-like regulatory domain-containing protein [Bryobacteraceae bacterium]
MKPRHKDHAVVQIQNNRPLMVRSYITQSGGEYHFAGLDPDDDYQLRAEYDGLWSHTRTFSRFDSGSNRKVNLTIRLGR